jgi:hypothetical protein
VLLAITNAVQEDITVFSSNENIKPVNDSEGNKVDGILISDFILTAHRFVGT